MNWILKWKPFLIEFCCILSDQANDVCGLYLQALSSGLNEVLKPYRQALLELEQEVC